MSKLKRLLKEAQQELDDEMERAYIVYRRKDLILARQYFAHLVSQYDHEPILRSAYSASKIMLGSLIFRPEDIEFYCKMELARQKREEEERGEEKSSEN